MKIRLAELAKLIAIWILIWFVLASFAWLSHWPDHGYHMYTITFTYGGDSVTITGAHDYDMSKPIVFCVQTNDNPETWETYKWSDIEDLKIVKDE